MINILSIIPIVGNLISQLIWSSSSIIINRIFIIHFIFGFIIRLLIIIHIILLHPFPSFNPLINNNSLFIFNSIILFFKDCFSYFIIFIIYNIYLFIEPDNLGNCDNLIIANSLITPLNIIPEWYFLLIHSILRIIPNKLIGAILIILLFIILLLIKLNLI